MRAVASVLVATVLLAGCSHPSGTTYEAGDVGRTIETTQASVVSSRFVKVAGEPNPGIGPLAGGALGASGSALAFHGSGLVAVIGGVLGAGVGYLAQKQMNNREGIEYVLQMEDGRTVTLVQNRESEEQPLPDGTPVLVQVSGQYTRVMPIPGPNAWAAATGSIPTRVPTREPRRSEHRQSARQATPSRSRSRRRFRSGSKGQGIDPPAVCRGIDIHPELMRLRSAIT